MSKESVIKQLEELKGTDVTFQCLVQGITVYVEGILTGDDDNEWYYVNEDGSNWAEFYIGDLSDDSIDGRDITVDTR